LTSTAVGDSLRRLSLYASSIRFLFRRLAGPSGPAALRAIDKNMRSGSETRLRKLRKLREPGKGPKNAVHQGLFSAMHG
jgi:hypothetical protein